MVRRNPQGATSDVLYILPLPPLLCCNAPLDVRLRRACHYEATIVCRVSFASANYCSFAWEAISRHSRTFAERQLHGVRP